MMWIIQMMLNRQWKPLCHFKTIKCHEHLCYLERPHFIISQTLIIILYANFFTLNVNRFAFIYLFILFPTDKNFPTFPKWLSEKYSDNWLQIRIFFVWKCSIFISNIKWCILTFRKIFGILTVQICRQNSESFSKYCG